MFKDEHKRQSVFCWWETCVFKCNWFCQLQTDISLHFENLQGHQTNNWFVHYNPTRMKFVCLDFYSIYLMGNLLYLKCSACQTNTLINKINLNFLCVRKHFICQFEPTITAKSLFVVLKRRWCQIHTWKPNITHWYYFDFHEIGLVHVSSKKVLFLLLLLT